MALSLPNAAASVSPSPAGKTQPGTSMVRAEHTLAVGVGVVGVGVGEKNQTESKVKAIFL